METLFKKGGENCFQITDYTATNPPITPDRETKMRYTIDESWIW